MIWPFWTLPISALENLARFSDHSHACYMRDIYNILYRKVIISLRKNVYSSAILKLPILNTKCIGLIQSIKKTKQTRLCYCAHVIIG